jgi:catechol 2,3-dioxygenase-like lactoylglutathione lyase family enzyme
LREPRAAAEQHDGSRVPDLRPALELVLVGVLGVNHLAFRTSDPNRLRSFYVELTGADEIDGEHDPIRVGQTLLVFFESREHQSPDDPDEIAFDVDSSGFDEVLRRARALGCEIRGPVEHTSFSKGFYLSDPDGRRLEFIHADPAVYWRE